MEKPVEIKNQLNMGISRKSGWLIGGVVAGIVLLVGGLIALAVATNGPGSSRFDDVEAMCMEDINSQLRDPSSTEFYELNDVTQTEGKEFYGFEGKLRSRNGFGGMVNMQFSCAVAYKDGEPEVTSFTY